MVIVRYSSWRAILAIALPIGALAIPLINWVVSPADFRARWLDSWSNLGYLVAIGWFAYALWPSAFRLLAGGPKQVRLDAGALVIGENDRIDLTQMKSVQIQQQALRHPRVAVGLGSRQAFIETAYQALGERKSAVEIARLILDSANSNGGNWPFQVA